MAMEIHNIEA